MRMQRPQVAYENDFIGRKSDWRWIPDSRNNMYGSGFERDLKKLERPWYLRSILLRVVQPTIMEATHSLFHAETSDHSQSFDFFTKAKSKSDNEHIGYALRQVQLVAIYLRSPSA